MLLMPHKKINNYLSLANNLELLENIENLVLSWIKQIEQVLAQSEQVTLLLISLLIT